ncbi:MAG TPA: metallopeptidase family protein [Candidatus Saccharimonadia bacterium]|jgi:predicted Zn-dependent protease with MMP-like domain|nr:metallopeptidase family protein [Candidatus Saccharimonadia bacterium]
MQVSEDEFYTLVQKAVAEIPERFAKHLNNVAFLTADVPTPLQQRASGTLHGRGQVLLGLYEGIPLPRRTGGYSGVVPDVITVFQNAHEMLAPNAEVLERMVHQTVWHEVAHYFGLDHGQIRALERP